MSSKEQEEPIKIRHELMPYLDGIRKWEANVELFKREFSYFKLKYGKAVEIYTFLNENLTGKSDSDIKNEISSLFSYLGLVESLGNSVVDMLVILLVANGHDFHMECIHSFPRVRHVSSISDLEHERVPLGIKLSFLKSNGISSFTSILDSELRNKVAHMNFEIKDNKIIIKGKPAYFFIIRNIFRLLTACDTVVKELLKLESEPAYSAKKGRR